MPALVTELQQYDPLKDEVYLGYRPNRTKLLQVYLHVPYCLANMPPLFAHYFEGKEGRGLIIEYCTSFLALALPLPPIELGRHLRYQIS